jgi:hypothetical protein
VNDDFNQSFFLGYELDGASSNDSRQFVIKLYDRHKWVPFLRVFAWVYGSRDVPQKAFVIPDLREVRGARHSAKDPETTTRAPSRAKTRALARPMPVSAPVISTVELFMPRACRLKEKHLAGSCSTWRTFAQASTAPQSLRPAAALALDFRCSSSHRLKSGLAAVDRNRCSANE